MKYQSNTVIFRLLIALFMLTNGISAMQKSQCPQEVSYLLRLPTELQDKILKELIIEQIKERTFDKLHTILDQRYVCKQFNNLLTSILTGQFTHNLVQDINATTEFSISEYMIDILLLNAEEFKQKWQKELNEEEKKQLKNVVMQILTYAPEEITEELDKAIEKRIADISNQQEKAEFLGEFMNIILKQPDEIKNLPNGAKKLHDSISDLIKLGANIKNIAIVARSGLSSVIQLLKAGLLIDAQDESGHTLLHEAARSGNSNIVRYLLESGAHVNLKSQNGNTALYFAVLGNHDQVVEQLLNAGAMVNIQNSVDDTPLHVATRNLDINNDIINKLLEAGIDINQKNNNGNTALHEAVMNNNQKLVQSLLLNNKINVDMQKENGETALSLAVWSSDELMVKKLLAAGANPNIPDQNGNTALHLAAAEGDKDIVHILLQAGADKSIENDLFDTAYDVAKNKAIQQYLEQATKPH